MSSREYFEFLHKLENDPAFCFNYIKENSINKKHPTFNQCLITISKDARYSRMAAEEIIKGRFELAEETISKDPLESYWYAKDIIKGRFELGEPAIASDAKCSYDYALRVIMGRFELGELTIAQHEGWSYEYAKNIIKGKLPEPMHNVMLAKRIAA